MVEFDYKDMLKRIRESEWAKEWCKESGSVDELEMIDDFFFLGFTKIVKVLPEILDDVTEKIRSEVDNLLRDADAIAESVEKGHLCIGFDLETYLDKVWEKVFEVACTKFPNTLNKRAKRMSEEKSYKFPDFQRVAIRELEELIEYFKEHLSSYEHSADVLKGELSQAEKWHEQLSKKDINTLPMDVRSALIDVITQIRKKYERVFEKRR